MIDKKIGPHIHQARMEAGLTQRALARELGIQAQFMGQIERGERPLPDRLFGMLPAALRRYVIDAAKADLEALA